MIKWELGVVAYICDPGLQETEAGGLLQTGRQPGPHSECRLVRVIEWDPVFKKTQNWARGNSVVKRP